MIGIISTVISIGIIAMLCCFFGKSIVRAIVKCIKMVKSAF